LTVGVSARRAIATDATGATTDVMTAETDVMTDVMTGAMTAETDVMTDAMTAETDAMTAETDVTISDVIDIFQMTDKRYYNRVGECLSPLLAARPVRALAPYFLARVCAKKEPGKSIFLALSKFTSAGVKHNLSHILVLEY